MNITNRWPVMLTIHNLWVVYDSGFTFSSHVVSVCPSCFVCLGDFRRIRRHLSKSAAITVPHALVGSRLDYCNSLFHGLSCKDFKKLPFTYSLRSISFVTCYMYWNHYTGYQLSIVLFTKHLLLYTNIAIQAYQIISTHIF